MLHGTLSLIDRYNDWAGRMKADAQSGKLMDSLGRGGITLTPIKSEDFFYNR